MDRSILSIRRKYLLLAAAGGLVGGVIMTSAPALAQPQEEITVTAPYEVHRKDAGRAASGAAIEVISLTRHVTYSGLDLTKQADVTELESRIKRTAKEACKQLDSLYPEAIYPSMPSNQNCIKAATDEGMTQVKAATAAAHKK
jgi:UrcA family protein